MGFFSKPEPQPEPDERLTGKELEEAQELVREQLKADREAVERNLPVKGGRS